MAVKGKHIVIVGLALLSVTAAAAYYQYTKIMDYCLSFKKVKLNQFNLNNLDVDVTLQFKNNSDLTIGVQSQEYKVYVGDVLITEARNMAPQELTKNAYSDITVNVKLSPKRIGEVLGKNANNLIMARDKVLVRIEMSLRVKLFFFTVGIPYTYNTNVKELTTSTPASASTQKNEGNCK